MFDFQEELRKLPDQPGVYIMHDKTDAIIYIGKAVSLRKRVRQYFQPSHDEGIKKKQMVEHIARFEYIITDSELEALVLECNLIKEHTPKYNTMLRDDKTYPYIRVTVQEDFPRVLFSRQVKKDKSRYFGPYTSAGAVKDTIELINKLYKLRTCSRKLPRDIGLDRACLNYHIHQCDAPCQGYISKEEYQKQIVKNAQALCKGLQSRGIKIVSDGTDNHLMLVDLTPFGLTGKSIEKLLDAAHITANKNTIPNDPQKPFVTSGIRLGTPAATSRGLKEDDFDKVAEAIAMIIKEGESAVEPAKAIIKTLTDKYPLAF